MANNFYLLDLPTQDGVSRPGLFYFPDEETRSAFVAPIVDNIMMNVISCKDYDLLVPFLHGAFVHVITYDFKLEEVIFHSTYPGVIIRDSMGQLFYRVLSSDDYERPDVDETVLSHHSGSMKYISETQAVLTIFSTLNAHLFDLEVLRAYVDDMVTFTRTKFTGDPKHYLGRTVRFQYSSVNIEMLVAQKERENSILSFPQVLRRGLS